MLLPVESWDSWRCRNGWLWVTHGPEIWKYESKVLGSVEVQSDDPQEISFTWFFFKKEICQFQCWSIAAGDLFVVCHLEKGSKHFAIRDYKGLSKEQERYNSSFGMSLETCKHDPAGALFSKTNTWQKHDSAKVWVFLTLGATDSLGYTLSVNSQNSQNSLCPWEKPSFLYLTSTGLGKKQTAVCGNWFDDVVNWESGCQCINESISFLES